MQQRKFRNIEERQLIKNEALENAQHYGLPDNIVNHLTMELDKYISYHNINSKQGATIAGIIPFNHEINIEYCLPGRRVMRHYVKSTKNENAEEKKNDENVVERPHINKFEIIVDEIPELV